MWHLTQIPKHVFFYWNTSKLPWTNYLSLQTFRQYNPDWEITLYRGPELTAAEGSEDIIDYWSEVESLDVSIAYIDIEGEISPDLSHCIGAYPSHHVRDVFRSDYFYTYMLLNYGGLWANMDIVFFKSMEEAVFNVPENQGYQVLALTPPYNNFLLASPESEFFRRLLQHITNIPKEEFLREFAIAGPLAYQHVAGTGAPSVLWLPTEVTESNFVGDAPNSSWAVGTHWHGGGSYGTYRGLNLNNYLEVAAQEGSGNAADLTRGHNREARITLARIIKYSLRIK